MIILLRDGSGGVSKRELRNILKACDIRASQDQVDMVLNALGVNGNELLIYLFFQRDLNILSRNDYLFYVK